MLNPEDEIVKKRLRVLELAKEHGNISAACKQLGISRAQFYHIKWRFQTHGIEGLLYPPHPGTTPPEIVQRIVDLTLEHPSWGLERLKEYLRHKGNKTSSRTIRESLSANTLVSSSDRCSKLEALHAQDAIQLSGEQLAFIEKHNPVYRERFLWSHAPGELLIQDTLLVKELEGVGKLFLHIVLDAYCSFAFGLLHTSRHPEGAVAVLESQAFPFYRSKGLSVQKVLTDKGREFYGKRNHAYEMFLKTNTIEHLYIQQRRWHINGFVKRFEQTAWGHFFKNAFDLKEYKTVEALQADWDDWLQTYNYETPQRGYRNMGRPPYERIEQYLAE